MPIYRIADLNVEVNPKFKICRKRLESYAVKSNESGKTDIAISVSDDEIRELDGEGYVFSAVSGTGKSTHTALWRRHFGNRVTMINDDKPVIRKCDGKFYAYGTPWMGKADIGTNTKAPVKAVYILQRAEENTAVRVLPSQVMKQLLEATVIDVERSRMEKLLELLDEFFKETPLFLLGCNMDESAVMTAYNAANGG